MPDTTNRFEHLPVLQELRDELIAAAHRQENERDGSSRLRSWLSRRMNATVVAIAFVLGGGAIAVAATGVLNGSPVKRQGPVTPKAGIGVPSPGGSRLLALRAADPQGGLPWGMRLVHTTRGEVCVQIARLADGQLGQLGVDGAFHDDGRFHPLAPNILPGYSDSGDVTCGLAAPVRIGLWPAGDRSAAPSPERTSFRPTAADLRSISWGLLGPHAVSVTYRTEAGVRTSLVAPGTGAYLIVSTVNHLPRSIGAGSEFVAGISGDAVDAGFPTGTGGSVIATTFRFGSFICSIGHDAPVARHCPTYNPTSKSRPAPPLNLHEPVQVRLVTQPPASCRAAYLVDPCYRAEIEFKAPYAVTGAGSEYFVQAKSSCSHARVSSWSLNNDVRRRQTVRTQSSGLFNCTSDQFKVEYLKQFDDSHPTAVVGHATLRAPGGG